MRMRTRLSVSVLLGLSLILAVGPVGVVHALPASPATGTVSMDSPHMFPVSIPGGKTVNLSLVNVSGYNNIRMTLLNLDGTVALPSRIGQSLSVTWPHAGDYEIMLSLVPFDNGVYAGGAYSLSHSFSSTTTTPPPKPIVGLLMMDPVLIAVSSPLGRGLDLTVEDYLGRSRIRAELLDDAGNVLASSGPGSSTRIVHPSSGSYRVRLTLAPNDNGVYPYCQYVMQPSYPLLPKTALSRTTSWSTLYLNRTYYARGHIQPFHSTDDSNKVQVRAYKKGADGRYRYVKSFTASYLYYSREQTAYRATIRFTNPASRGVWKFVAYHPADSRNSATYGSADYVRLR